MTKRISGLVLAAFFFHAGAVFAQQVSLQIGAGDTARLFGGTDAEGGIGDWYVSNGVVEAIIDDVGPATDLTAVVGAGNEPPIQSEIADTGGTLVDLGVVGQNDDQLAQMFTVGGLSTANFVLYDGISAPTPGTVRATGKLLFPPISVRPTPCVDIVTDYTANGTDPFLTVTTTATNNCGVTLTGFGGFLDVFIWTLRGIVPFSGGGTVTAFGGKGFNHPVLDLSNPVNSLELPTFLGAPGLVRPADGIMDPANGTTSGEVSYGVLPVNAVTDVDGAGATPPVTTAVNSLFGVSSTLVTALGNGPVAGGNAAGATLSYTRHIYVGGRNDVRAVSDGVFGELATRLSFSTGTISGDVGAGDTPDVEASILITRLGRCAGNASVTCKAAADCTGGTGPCNDPLPVTAQGVGAATSHVRTDAMGVFGGVVLPRGLYELRVSAAERDDVVLSPVTVPGGGNVPVSIPTMNARGTVTFTVHEKTAHLPLLPAKLTFKGVSPTLDPQFHRDFKATLGGNDIFPETFGGTQAGTMGHAAGQGNVVYTATGTGNIQVHPGTYDVYVSRGLEYNVIVQRVTVPAAGSANVDAKLKRVLKTKNALSADFHVHSGRSLDASAPLRDRVAAFAAEGVEVMVSTDHDKNVDYAPIISGLGLTSRLRSIIGDEMTGSVPNPPNFPSSIGHINAWPLVVAKDDRRDGTVQDEYVAPNWIFKRLRDAGAEVVQYNHPRAGVSGLTTIGIFNNIGCNRCANAIDTPCVQDSDCPALPAPQDCTCVGYQPDRTIGAAPNDILQDKGVLGPGSPMNPDGFSNLDFDVMEIANGNKDTDFPGIRQVRRDWLSLLNQGIYKPGTGVSDSHRITVEHAGWARTFVLGVGDDPTTFTTTALDAQVKAGNMVISGGPYLELTATAKGGGTVGMGKLLKATDGNVKLKIRVSAPAWMPVDEVRIIANGFQVASYDGTTTPKVKPAPLNFQSTGGTSRFSATVTRTITQDTYFIVEAGAKLPANPNTLPPSPAIVAIVEPNVVPIAISNPIFADKDGNAAFDPPGLPVMMASTAPVEEEAPGFLARLRRGFQQLAMRLRGEVNAEDQAPGEMTGVTKEQKAEAVKKGEYFPLRQFSLPPEAVEAARKAAEAEQKPAETTPDK